MLHLTSTAGIQVGSEVVYVNPSQNSRVYRFCRDTVTAVTKGGQVTTEKGYKFYVNGSEMKTATRRYPCYQLCNTEKVEEIRAREAA